MLGAQIYYKFCFCLNSGFTDQKTIFQSCQAFTSDFCYKNFSGLEIGGEVGYP